MEQGVERRREGSKVRGGGALWEQENRKICEQLIIGLYHLALLCVSVRVCVTGAVSLAGAQNNLWAVEGGNKLVCSGLLKMANANLLQAQVNSISPVYSGTLP